jgi:hypothetical protein
VDHLRSLADIGVTGCVLSIVDGYDLDAIGAVGEAVSKVAFKER